MLQISANTTSFAEYAEDATLRVCYSYSTLLKYLTRCPGELFNSKS